MRSPPTRPVGPSPRRLRTVALATTHDLPEPDADVVVTGLPAVSAQATDGGPENAAGV